MVFNPRERSECACAYFYSDPLFERKKLFAFIIVQSNEEGTTERARCVASCSSNRPRRKKESDDRITDPLFQRKLLLRGKSEASKCFHFIHIFMRN